MSERKQGAATAEKVIVIEDAGIQKLPIEGCNDERVHLWNPDNQEIILQSFENLLPEVMGESPRCEISNHWQFKLQLKNGVLDWAKAKPLGPKSKVPSDTVAAFEEAVRNLELRSEDPRVPPSKRNVVKAFRLPDPETAFEQYYLHGPPWNRRFTVLWGFTREGQPAVDSQLAIAKLRQRAYNSRFYRLLWLRVFPVILIIALGLSAAGTKAMIAQLRDSRLAKVRAGFSGLEADAQSALDKAREFLRRTEKLHMQAVQVSQKPSPDIELHTTTKQGLIGTEKDILDFEEADLLELGKELKRVSRLANKTEGDEAEQLGGEGPMLGRIIGDARVVCDDAKNLIGDARKLLDSASFVPALAMQVKFLATTLKVRMESVNKYLQEYRESKREGLVFEAEEGAALLVSLIEDGDNDDGSLHDLIEKAEKAVEQFGVEPDSARFDEIEARLPADLSLADLRRDIKSIETWKSQLSGIEAELEVKPGTQGTNE